MIWSKVKKLTTMFCVLNKCNTAKMIIIVIVQYLVLIVVTINSNHFIFSLLFYQHFHIPTHIKLKVQTSYFTYTETGHINITIYNVLTSAIPFTKISSKTFCHNQHLLLYGGGGGIYNYLCNQSLSPLMLWVRIPFRRGVLETTLCDKVCQWFLTGPWFSPGIPVSSTNKTDRPI